MIPLDEEISFSLLLLHSVLLNYSKGVEEYSEGKALSIMDEPLGEHSTIFRRAS